MFQYFSSNVISIQTEIRNSGVYLSRNQISIIHYRSKSKKCKILLDEQKQNFESSDFFPQLVGILQSSLIKKNTKRKK